MSSATIQPDQNQGKTLYFSFASGNNLNDGLTPETPLKDCTAIFEKIKYDTKFEKYSAFLFKADEVHEGGLQVIYGGWRYGGASPDQPLLIGAYGSGERPIIRTVGNEDGIFFKDSPGNIIVKDLKFTGRGRANGLRIFGPQDNFTIVNCVFEKFAYGMNMDCEQKEHTIDNVLIDECILIDNILETTDPNDKHSQGLFVSQVTNLQIRNTVVDNNGLKNTFCHGLYSVQSNQDVVVEDCIISRNGFAGLQMRGRRQSARRNFLFGNGNNIGAGHAMSTTTNASDLDPTNFIWWEDSVIEQNLIGYASDIMPKAGDDGKRGYGIEYHRVRNSEIKNNIFLGENRPSSRYAFTRPLRSPSDISACYNNTVIGYNTENWFATPLGPNETYDNNFYQRQTSGLMVIPTINYDKVLKTARDRRRHEAYTPPSTYYNFVAGALGLQPIY
jgi:hypothetical protein